MSYQEINLHNREHQIISTIERDNRSLPDSFREAKYKKMSNSPYLFLRGTNHFNMRIASNKIIKPFSPILNPNLHNKLGL